MSSNAIKIYPVDNGDMFLISLDDKEKAKILIDCKIRENSKGKDDETKYDVKADLLKSINKRDGVHYIDAFILTHPDQDHCHGFESNFYQGDPKDYKKEHKDKELIIIDELWYTPRIIEKYKGCNDDLCSDAKAFKKEALRRYDLHKSNHKTKNDAGNRIVIIGYGKHLDLKGLEDISYIAGRTISKINSIEKETFSFFVHAPFRDDLPSASKGKDNIEDKNNTSVVLQARFKDKKEDSKFSCRAIFGGDADHYVWEKIIKKTEDNKKTEALKWDIFVAPHHCSWTFFNDTSYDIKENQTPKESSLKMIGKSYRQEGAYIIASCRKILNEKPNPPHYPAKEEYVKEVKEKNFLNTATEPKEDSPEPIEFIIAATGPARPPRSKVNSAITSAGGGGAASTIIKQG